MSTVKVGINGFGRIGRLVFRAGLDYPDIQFLGINDLVPPENIAYLLKYDSTHGPFKGTVEAKPDGIVVNGKFIPCFSMRNPEELPWGKLGVDYVVESTGLFTDYNAPDVSVVDLTFRSEKATSYKEICAAMKEAAAGELRGILAYTEDPVVSTDFTTDPHSSIFDAGAGIELNANFFKVVCWYDNEWGYSNRMIDLMLSMAAKEALTASA